jgi:O-antigen ligase
MFYYLKNKKHKFIYLFMIVFEIAMLFFTTSRGGFLTFAITSIFLVFYLLYKNKNTKIVILSLVSLIALFSIIILLNLDYSIAIFHRLFDNFFYDNNRFTLWKTGWESFTAHPIFGSGIIYIIWNNYFKLYHNTFLHTLATLGIFGFLALIWQFILIIKIFIKNINKESIILAILLIAANIHGMIDNGYYMPQFMIIFFIIISAVENSSIENSLTTEY